MGFVQMIELNTSKADELIALDREWEQATEGKRTLRRAVVGRDRNNPNRHVILAFFDSYESAMENSKLPETQSFAERQSALLDSPPVFTDFDIVDDRP
jgi:hypothetical protein